MKRVEDIALWLANDAPHDTFEALFGTFCRRIVQSRSPVWRASLGLKVLHPEVSGWQHIWTDDSLSVHGADRATAPTSQS